MLEPIGETKYFIHKIKGAIDYVGGCSDKVITKEIEEFLDTCFRNGIELKIKIKENDNSYDNLLKKLKDKLNEKR